MPQHPNADENSYAVNQNTAIQGSANAPTDEHVKPESSGQSTKQYQQGSVADLERDIRAGEKWIIGIGIATVIINTLIAFIYWDQLREMRRATQAATASAEAAKSALSVTNDALRMDKRAWVGITKPITLDHFLEDQLGSYDIGYTFILKNYGPSVARRLATDFRAANRHTIDDALKNTCNSAHEDLEPPHTQGGVRGGYLMFPGDEMRSPGTELGSMAKLRSDGSLYIVGCIVYEDQFGEQHTTHTCVQTFNDITLGAMSKKPQVLYVCPSEAN